METCLSRLFTHHSFGIWVWPKPFTIFGSLVFTSKRTLGVPDDPPPSRSSRRAWHQSSVYKLEKGEILTTATVTKKWTNQKPFWSFLCPLIFTSSWYRQIVAEKRWSPETPGFLDRCPLHQMPLRFKPKSTIVYHSRTKLASNLGIRPHVTLDRCQAAKWESITESIWTSGASGIFPAFRWGWRNWVVARLGSQYDQLWPSFVVLPKSIYDIYDQ